MPDRKQSNRLRELVRQPAPTAPPISSAGAPDAPPPAPADLYPISTHAAPHLVELPPEAELLGQDLQDLARAYITARRRTGEALLEAAQCLKQARDRAEHGEWLIFLRVTGASPDTAEQLLHIADRAQDLPAFAEAIRRGWLNQTTAAIAAKPSTPVEVISRILAADAPPSVQDVQRERRAALAPAPAGSAPDQIPIKSVFAPSAAPPWLAPLCADLARAQRACAQRLAGIPALDDDAAAALRDEVEQLLRVLAQVTTALGARAER